MPTIGILVPALELGGGVPAVAEFLAQAASRSPSYDLKLVSLASSATDDCSVRLASPATWAKGVRTAEGRWNSRPFVRVGAVLSEFEFQRYRSRTALSIAVSGCDVLQVVSGTPAWALSVCGLGKPVSVQCATRAIVERRRKESGATGASARWRRAMTIVTDRMEESALRRVDAIQVENPWMLDYARKLNLGREVDLRFAPPGVDADTFTVASKRNPRAGYILCVGRLDDIRKNVDLLLEAYALLPETARQDWQLVLAGQAGPKEAFWARAEALRLRDRIRFVERPSTEALVTLYQNAGVFVLPSDEEGLGVVLLEAMSCGIPVVSTRSGGPDGLITEGGDGFLVERDDTRALSERIARLHFDERLNREMGVRARETIEARYTNEIAGDVFRDVWDSLMRRGAVASRKAG